MDPLKILLVQRASGIGGAERHIIALALSLRELGLDPSVCVMQAKGSTDFADILDSNRLLCRTGRNHPSTVAYGIRDLATCIRSFRPDLIHTHLIYADVFGQHLARFARVPAVATLHNLSPIYENPLLNTLAKRSLANSARTISVSGAVANYLSELHTINPSRNHIIPLGIDPDFWKSPTHPRALGRTSSRSPRLLLVGRFHPGKGHRIAIEAIRSLADRGITPHLTFAGDGPLRTTVVTEARHALGGPHVSDLGFVSDPRALYWDADVCLVPTSENLREGFGLVALESMAAGTPVIASNVGGLPEVLGPTGMLVAPDDAPALAGAIEKTINLDSFQRSIRERQVADRVRREFNLTTVAERTVAVYEAAIERSRPTAGRRHL
jgi:glycosyltransferase involved in cell wall biosynthesis